MARPRKPLANTLREVGLATYPQAHLKSPWPGHLDLAVKDKTFAYLTVEGEPFRISVKLPHSCSVALMLPFTAPTAYGLGKSGWVSVSPPPNQEPPLELLLAWIDESYRAVAPKKLVAQLDLDATSPASRATPPHKAATAIAKKVTAKNTSAKKAPVKRPQAKKTPASAKKTLKKPAPAQAKKPAAKKTLAT